MSKALDTVKMEHRNLGKVLRVLSAEVGKLRGRSRKPDLELLYSILYYIRVFPDRYHHPKEEDYLFSALRRRRPDAVPVLDQLRSEHDRFAGLLEEVEAALRRYDAHYPQGLDELEQRVNAYLEFQWRHMDKEEREVLPLAEAALSEEDWARIDHAFARNADPVFGEHLKTGFEALYRHIVERADDERE
jgi:hemerythrin-like domain-containing protein